MDKEGFLNIYRENIKEILSRAPLMLQSMASVAPKGAKFNISIDLIGGCKIHSEAFRIEYSDDALVVISNFNQYIDEVTIPLYRNYVLNNLHTTNVFQDSEAKVWRHSMMEFIEKTLVNMKDCFYGFDVVRNRVTDKEDKEDEFIFSSKVSDDFVIEFGGFEKLFAHLLGGFHRVNHDEIKDSDLYQTCSDFVNAIADKAAEQVEVTKEDLITIEKGLMQ